MSIKCLMNGLEVNYPCSPVCALFGDCVTAFEAQIKENVRTNADRIRVMSDEELADFLADKYVTESCLRLNDKGYEATEIQKRAIKHTLYYTWMKWLQQPAAGGS